MQQTDLLTRIDTPLKDRVDSVLVKSPHVMRHRLFCETRDEGSVTLLGKVDSFFEKQMAQEAVRSLDGVGRIHNRLEVACG